MKNTAKLMRLILTVCALLCPTLAFAQAGNFQTILLSGSGQPLPGVNVAVCSTGLTTTAASVTNNIATLTMSSNPITARFLGTKTLTVSSFTGGDTYFNGTFTIAAVGATTISYALTHANASATSNGKAFQTGDAITSCAPVASLFTDDTAAVAAANPTTSDSIGNVSVWVASGVPYQIQYYGANVVTKVVEMSVGLTSTTILAANNAFTGNNTFSGNNTATGTLNSATIATNDGVSPNLVTLDFRGTTIPSNTSLNKTIAYNVTTGGFTDSMERSQMTVSSVPGGGSVVSKYILTSLANSAGGNVVDGASTEGQVTGTLAGTVNSLTGNEMPATVTSTGGTVTTAMGGIGYVFSTAGSTTAITNAYGFWGRGCIGTISGVAPTNCYGSFFSKQTAGGIGVASSRNYSIGSEGLSLHLFDGGIAQAGMEIEDNAHVTHSLLKVLNDNSVNLYAVSTAGLIFVNSAGGSVGKIASGALTPFSIGSLGLGTNALPFPGLFYGGAATNNAQLTGSFTAARTHTGPDASGTLLISGNGDGTHAIKNQSVRFSGVLGGTCPTAAAIGAACTSGNINWTTSFGDNSYAVVCTLNGSLTGQPHIVATTYQAAGVGITITIAADTAAAANVAAAGFTHCIAIHD